MHAPSSLLYELFLHRNTKWDRNVGTSKHGNIAMCIAMLYHGHRCSYSPVFGFFALLTLVCPLDSACGYEVNTRYGFCSSNSDYQSLDLVSCLLTFLSLLSL